MPRLIDAELLTGHLFANIEYDKTVDDGIEKTDKEAFAFKCGWNDALKSVMENAPTIDAVEVVRCKDCEYFLSDEPPICELTMYGAKDNRYCAWGKRKDAEEE